MKLNQRAIRAAGALLLGAIATAPVSAELLTETVVLRLDQEEKKPGGGALNSGTQSVNRYHSDLRKIKEATFTLDTDAATLSVAIGTPESGGVKFQQLQLQQLVPILPYEHAAQPDAFDAANLMLAEYARNGISLSHQRENEYLAHFYTEDNFLASAEEYLFQGGVIAPNPALAPSRMSITNNCLFPGLWEINASDSAGEMYHAWLTLPESFYYAAVRVANGLDCSDDFLRDALGYKGDMGSVLLDRERLRAVSGESWNAPATLAADKLIGGYSSQDSRRKVQRGFYRILRDDAPVPVTKFGELEAGDVFALHAFIPPGIYTTQNPQKIPFDPSWDEVAYRFVEPRTSYGATDPKNGSLGFLEIELRGSTTGRRIIAGNLPLDLLVFQDDYAIPAFGAGVLPSSELVERRHLRIKEGPVPHYAYLVQETAKGEEVINNHEAGLEQIYFRPVRVGDAIHMRITLVSYERIVDLMEVTAPVPQAIADLIEKSSEQYRPPLYRTYSDANLL